MISDESMHCQCADVQSSLVVQQSRSLGTGTVRLVRSLVFLDFLRMVMSTGPMASNIWTTLTSPSDTFDGMLSAMLPFSFSKYPAVGTSKSDLRFQETPHTGNVPCLCCLSGTACGLSPRIEDTPMGCSSPVASSGGDCVPKDLFAFAEDIVSSSIEIRRGGGGGVWVAGMASSVEGVLAWDALYNYVCSTYFQVAEVDSGGVLVMAR